jgi:hypothetical protein
LAFTTPQAEQVLEDGYQRSSDVHGAAGPTGFVLDLASEFAPADTGDVAGEAPVAEHPGDVQVLDHYRAVGPRESGGELV